MSNTPTAVKKASEDADKLHTQVYGGVAEAPADKPAEAPADKPAEASVAAKPAEASVAAKPAEKSAVDPWEHKYNTLRGMFNAEMRKKDTQLTQLMSEKENLEHIIATMQAQPAPTTPQSKLVRPEEIEEYGPEMADFIARQGRDAVSNEINEMKSELAELRSQNLQLQQSLSTVNARSVGQDRDAVLQYLTDTVPDWRAINVNPEFVEWLQQEDPYSGEKFQNLITTAFQKNDGRRVAKFFVDFVEDRQAKDPTREQKTPQVRLDTLVAPGKPQRSVSAQPNSESELEIVSQDAIQRFYQDCTKGVYKNRPEERAKMEARIHRAVAEGRVR